MARLTVNTGFRWFVTILGTVALVAGTASVLLGLASIPSPGRIRPNADSEFRFYAVWYAVAGIVMLRSAPKIESAGAVVRTVAWAFFVAGCARGLSWLLVGRPHWSQIALMIIELLLPAVLIPWQAAVERRARQTLSSGDGAL